MALIVLASRSPRRIELLERLGLKPLVIEPPEDVEVMGEDFLDPRFIAMMNASRKAEYAYRKVRGKVKAGQDLVIIGADTVVVVEDKILGKPRSIEEAKKMLSLLSGRWHRVCSGLAIIAKIRNRTQRIIDVGDALVKFKHLTPGEIEWYISTKEPLDAAGAYRIQGLGGVFVEEVRGDYYSIVGLPLSKLYKYLAMLRIFSKEYMGCKALEKKVV